MNSIQLLALKSTLNIVVKRYAFTPKDRIKLLNSQSKSLYGPVIKKTKTPPERSKPTNASNEQKINISSSSFEASDGPTIKKPETNHGSEIYWILGNRLKEIVDSSDPRTTDAEKVDDNVEKKTLAKDKQTSVIQQPIALSNEELKNVLKHPLHSDVLSTAPVDIRAPEFRSIPSVGRVLQYTMSEAARSALLNWKLGKISELGEQGFADLQQSHLNTGKMFHSSIQQYFLANEIPEGKLWESVRGVLDTFTAIPESVEKPVFHPTLKYKGICDCVSEVENQLTIIEWKKSERSKPTLGATYDAPLQLCAYLGALNSIPEFHGRIRQGMVVVAYENGKPADVYKMNEVMLRRYWRNWLGRLHEFWVRSRDDTLPEPV